jgi:hypothetical protein
MGGSVVLLLRSASWLAYHLAVGVVVAAGATKVRLASIASATTTTTWDPPCWNADVPVRSLQEQDFIFNETYATCDGCWCIPDGGTDRNECPSDIPLTVPDFPQSPWLDNLNALQLDNPLSLDCDPYAEEGCDTVPPLVEGKACVWEMTAKEEGVDSLVNTSTSCADYYSYRLTTVNETVEEAKEKGMHVTHEGSCGLCSTFQDWAVYMTQPDLTEVGTRCGIIFLLNQTWGIECFMKAGLTEGCANIWAWNSYFTSQ